MLTTLKFAGKRSDLRPKKVKTSKILRRKKVFVAEFKLKIFDKTSKLWQILRFSRFSCKDLAYFPWKSNFLNVDNIEIWKRSDLLPKMAKNLKILAVSRIKGFVPEMKLKIFDI